MTDEMKISKMEDYRAKKARKSTTSKFVKFWTKNGKSRSALEEPRNEDEQLDTPEERTNYFPSSGYQVFKDSVIDFYKQFETPIKVTGLVALVGAGLYALSLFQEYNASQPREEHPAEEILNERKEKDLQDKKDGIIYEQKPVLYGTEEVQGD